MPLNTTALLALIESRPGIRCVEIAEELDCQTFQIRPTLTLHILAGRVIAAPVTAPNGKVVTAFSMFHLPAKEAAPEIPGLVADRQPGASRVAIAMRYLAQVGRTDALTLRVVMQLEAKEYPARVLGRALAANRIHREGSEYVFGPSLSFSAQTKKAIKQTAKTREKREAISPQTQKINSVAVAFRGSHGIFEAMRAGGLQ